VWNPALSQLIDHATELCDHQARSEAILGFHDSAAVYQQMADDARLNKGWISHQRDPARRNPVTQPSPSPLSPNPPASSPAPAGTLGAHP
jgi:hypothetical protein